MNMDIVKDLFARESLSSGKTSLEEMRACLQSALQCLSDIENDKEALTFSSKNLLKENNELTSKIQSVQEHIETLTSRNFDLLNENMKLKKEIANLEERARDQKPKSNHSAGLVQKSGTAARQDDRSKLADILADRRHLTEALQETLAEKRELEHQLSRLKGTAQNIQIDAMERLSYEEGLTRASCNISMARMQFMLTSSLLTKSQTSHLRNKSPLKTSTRRPYSLDDNGLGPLIVLGASGGSRPYLASIKDVKRLDNFWGENTKITRKTSTRRLNASLNKTECASKRTSRNLSSREISDILDVLESQEDDYQDLRGTNNGSFQERITFSQDGPTPSKGEDQSLLDFFGPSRRSNLSVKPDDCKGDSRGDALSLSSHGALMRRGTLNKKKNGLYFANSKSLRTLRRSSESSTRSLV